MKSHAGRRITKSKVDLIYKIGLEGCIEYQIARLEKENSSLRELANNIK